MQQGTAAAVAAVAAVADVVVEEGETKADAK